MSEPLLSLQKIQCRYDQDEVVRQVSFTLQAGQIACLLGPSGCGKTTTLRAIAGLEPLTGGTISIQGREASRAGWQLPPEKRGLGMVFQDHALFPHLSIGENVGFALRDHSASARRQRVAECLEQVRLAGMEKRFPHELSGGQQQRVALARALASRPRLILLDEPFASLDLDLRRQLNQEVRDILLNEGITGVIVTHDQEEAFAIATHVGIMRAGELIQWDSPYNIYHSPVTRFVAEFAGSGAFLDGTVLPDERVATAAGELASHRPLGFPSGSPVTVLLRPEDVVADADGPLRTSVIHRVFTGPNILYRLALDNGEQLTCLTGSHQDLPIGASLRVRIAAEHLVLFAA